MLILPFFICRIYDIMVEYYDISSPEVNQMKQRMAGQIGAAGLSGIMAGMLMLSGCAGPSTQILPYDPGYIVQTDQETAAPRLEPANSFYLRESLEYLTRTPRVSGSQEEEQAVRYLEHQLTGYGYEVEIQKFPLTAKASQEAMPKNGMNLIATRKADTPDSDILIISTRHDTVADSPGAVSSGAAMAVWLESARLLADIPTDTQIRFVSFSGSEDHYAGSQAYVQTLQTEEKHRMVGVIQLDEMGDINQEEIVLGSIDGQPVMVGDMLAEAAGMAGQKQWSYQKKINSDIVSLIRGQVPAVSVSQRWDSYANHLPQDRADNVAVDQLVFITEQVAAAAARIMSSETPSLTAKAHFINDLSNRVYVQEPEQVLPFGEEPDRFFSQTGLIPQLVASNTDEAGSRVDTYRYPMKWFKIDQEILTSFFYRDGKLDSISLDAGGAGISFDEMKERLTACYGEPGEWNQGLYGTEYNWVAPIYRAIFALTPTLDGFAVEIREFQTDRMELIKYRPDGTPEEQTAGDGRRYDSLFELTAAVFGPDLAGAAVVDIYTDGIGAAQGYLDIRPADAADETAAVVIGIDGEEALLPDGSFRDYPGTVKMLLEYYGQVLEQTTHSGTAAVFYETFSDETEPAGFAESFRLFVVCQKPDPVIHESDEKILFFYEDQALTEIRSRIRRQLKLVDYN